MSATNRTLLQNLGFNDKDRKTPEHDRAVQYLCQPEVLAKLISKVMLEVGKDKVKDVVVLKAETEYVINKGQGQYKSHIGFADLVIWFAYSYKDEEADRSLLLRVLELEELHEGRLKEDDHFDFPGGLDDEEGIESTWVNERKKKYEMVALKCQEYRRLFKVWSGIDIRDSISLKKGSHTSTDDAEKEIDALLAKLKNDMIKPFPGIGWIRDNRASSELLVEVKTTELAITDAIRQIKLYWDNLDFYHFHKLQHPKSVLVTNFEINEQDSKTLKDQDIVHVRLGKLFQEFLSKVRDKKAASEEI